MVGSGIGPGAKVPQGVALAVVGVPVDATSEMLNGELQPTAEPAAAAADGVPLNETDCREMFDLIRQFDPIKTSMLVDFEHQRPLELEEICGAVLSRSLQLKREAPYTFTVYHLLRRLTVSRMGEGSAE